MFALLTIQVLPAPTRLVLDFMRSVLPRDCGQDKAVSGGEMAATTAQAERAGSCVADGKDGEGGRGVSEAGGDDEQLLKQEEDLKQHASKRKAKADDPPAASSWAAELPSSFKVPPCYAAFSGL